MAHIIHPIVLIYPGSFVIGNNKIQKYGILKYNVRLGIFHRSKRVANRGTHSYIGSFTVAHSKTRATDSWVRGRTS